MTCDRPPTAITLAQTFQPVSSGSQTLLMVATRSLTAQAAACPPAAPVDPTTPFGRVFSGFPVEAYAVRPATTLQAGCNSRAPQGLDAFLGQEYEGEFAAWPAATPCSNARRVSRRARRLRRLAGGLGAGHGACPPDGEAGWLRATCHIALLTRRPPAAGQGGRAAHGPAQRAPLHRSSGAAAQARFQAPRGRLTVALL